MSVKINIPQFLQHIASDVTVADADGSTVGECLNHFIQKYPQFKESLFDKKGKLLKYVDVYVNGESTYPEELSKPVDDGDELHIVNIIAGG